MIQGGVVLITCDQCGFEDKVKTIDHVPAEWYVLYPVDERCIPSKGKHLCTKECLIKYVAD